ncbi:MAG: hypothetical protein J6D45_02140 [Clostridia bacterium]|nr:hypothetical protein [Clostridia bacterium]
MRTQPPIVAAAKKHGIDSFRELTEKGLYTITIPPKLTYNEIKELLEKSDHSTAERNLNV